MAQQPFGHNIHGLKSRVLLCPFPLGELGSHLTMSPGLRPTSVPSGIIHPTVWPQYTNVTDRQDDGRIA